MTMANCNPFFYERGETGILLVHGFSGSPPEMRLLGEYLAGRGITVSGVRLAGHGTTPEDFSMTTWKDWVASADAEANELKKKCATVFCAGLSMGGAITLYLSRRHDFRGIMTLSAPSDIRDFKLKFVPFLSRFVKFVTMKEDNDLDDKDAIRHVQCYKKLPLSCVKSFLEFHKLMKTEIPQVTTPVLIMHGLKDRTLLPENAQILYDRIGSTEKRLVWLERSGHAITVDSDKEEVFSECHKFILERASRCRETS